jgi:hypothetical protein
METTKKCKVCGSVLPVSEFGTHWKSKDGYRNVCKSCEGSREKKTACKVVSTVVKRSIEGGIAALKGIAAKDLIEELRFRGYKGKLVFTREVVV